MFDQFRSLLVELRRERGGHSWMLEELPADGDPCEWLHAKEQARRPTTIYFYTSLLGELVGVGAVANRIHRGFLHDGFPVIARAYVRPSRCGQGIYSAMLDHRLRECHALGDELHGIHIGTANAKVRDKITSAPYGFVYVGAEILDEVTNTTVDAYLWCSPRFRCALATELADRSTPDSVRGDLECLLAGTGNGLTTARVQRMRQASQHPRSDTSAVGRLLELLSYIHLRNQHD